MKEKTKVWQKISLIVGVFAIIAIAAYLSNPTLFKGSLNNVSIERCDQLSIWAEEGDFTKNGGLGSEADECNSAYNGIVRDGMNRYREYMAERCRELREWNEQGELTERLRGDLSEAHYCATSFMDVWYAPTAERCDEIARWAENGEMTANGVSLFEAEKCNREYNNVVNEAMRGFNEYILGKCTELRKWKEQGELTKRLGGDLKEVHFCATYLSAFWNTPSLERCDQLSIWADEGKFTANGGTGREADMCNSMYNNIVRDGMMRYGQYMLKRCDELRAMAENGVLTSSLNGDLTEAYYCSNYYPNIWNTPSVEKCDQLSTWARQGQFTSNGGRLDIARKCDAEYNNIVTDAMDAYNKYGY